MKEKNRDIVNNINKALEEAWSKTDGDISRQIEIVLEYKTKDGHLEHQIAHYWRNGSGHFIGTVGSVFDFDFYGIREIVDFWMFDEMKR